MKRWVKKKVWVAINRQEIRDMRARVHGSMHRLVRMPADVLMGGGKGRF
jgi:hypothetical protein